MTNVLLLSVGTRNKIVQYFKRALNGRGNVVATDMSTLAPALYDADRRYIVPRINAPNYLEIVLEICRKERISGVLSLIDPELSLLAKNETLFAQNGVRVVGSSFELCERALDKIATFRWLSENGYNCAKTFSTQADFYASLRRGELDFPVFVKPICGSASVAINKVYDRETVDALFANADKPLLIQEFLNGQEIGVDCYIDVLSGELVSCFTKKKILMRAGETDKAVSFKDPKLFALIERFVADCGWRGQIDIDVFDIGGEYYISEVNPRFGGGYPHAFECGCDHMSLIINNLNGVVNKKQIGAYQDGVYMMKYVDLAIKENFDVDERYRPGA